MTIANENFRNEYTGNGVLDTYAYTFRIIDETHIKVYVNAVLQTLTTHYTVSNVGASGGGNIVFVTPPPDTQSITFVRDVPLTQLLDLITGGAFPSESLEQGLDLVVMIVQQQQEILDRCIKYPTADVSPEDEVSLAAARAGLMFGFDSNGDPLMLSDVIGVVAANVELTDAANIDWNCTQGNVFHVLLGGNRTLNAPTGTPYNGQKALFIIEQDDTGNRTITLNAIFEGGTDVALPITLTTTANKQDYMLAVYRSARQKWQVLSFVKGYDGDNA